MEGLGSTAGAEIDIEFGGKHYLLPPLTLRDLGVVENHIIAQRPNILTLAAEALHKLPEDFRERAWDRALADAKRQQSVPAHEVLAWISDTIDGFAFSLWLCLERRYPGQISRDGVYDLLQKMAEDDMQKLIARRNWASGLDEQKNSSCPTSADSTEARAEAVAEPVASN